MFTYYYYIYIDSIESNENLLFIDKQYMDTMLTTLWYCTAKNIKTK